MKRLLLVMIALTLIAATHSKAGIRAQSDGETTFFMTEDGAYSVWLPQGWFADSFENGISIANDEAIINVESIQDFGPGQVGIIVRPLTPLQISDAGIDVDSTLVEALELYAVPVADLDGFEFAVPTEIHFFERPMAHLAIHSELIESMAFMFEMGPDILGFGAVNGLPGILTDFGKQGMDIISTVRYSLPLEDRFDEGNFSFGYPADWYTDAPLDDFVIIANDSEAIDADEFRSGWFAMVILTPAALEVTDATISEMAEELGLLLRANSEVEIEAIVFSVHGRDVALVEIPDFGFPENEGGVMAVDTQTGIIGIIYVSLKGESHLIWQTALNMLLSVE